MTSLASVFIGVSSTGGFHCYFEQINASCLTTESQHTIFPYNNIYVDEKFRGKDGTLWIWYPDATYKTNFSPLSS